MTEAALPQAFKWPWFVLAGIVVGYIALAYLIPPGADTLWRLHIASGLLNGQTLYRDMIEVNPPLWFWGAVPAAAFGGYPALVAINLAATAAGLILFRALASLTLDRKGQCAAVLGLGAGLLLVNVAEIGQREQAFLLACALWSGLAAARMESKAIPVWLVIGATCFSAYGFALKHYFVLVPIALEGLVLWHKKRAWRPLRLETLLLAGLAIAYGLAVIYLTPDYLGRVLGLVQASYYGFGPWNSVSPIERQVRLFMQCAFIFIPVLALFLTQSKSNLARALLVGLLTSGVIVVLQQKGWRYHLITANGLSIIVLSLMLSALDRKVATGIGKIFVPLGLAVILWSSAVQPAIANLKTNGQPLSPILADIISKEPGNNHLAILSSAPDNAFFPLARAGRPHWSRHYSMWMMPGLLTPQDDAKKEALRLVERARILSEFTADLTCTPPDLIVGEVGYFRNPEPKLFDAMAFLREDREFSTWMDAHYVKGADIGQYPIWRLKAAKPAPLNCTKPR